MPANREWFEQYRKPRGFLREADRGLTKYFVSDKAPPNYLREAYIAGSFASIWEDARGACRIRLVSENDQFPDAEFCDEDTFLRLELTMALEKDRRMFDDWRKLRAMAEKGEFEQSKTTEQHKAVAREAIPRVVGMKAEKHYATSVNLLVNSDDARALSGQEMADLTNPWKDSFQAIWILTGLDAVMVWPNLKILRGIKPF